MFKKLNIILFLIVLVFFIFPKPAQAFMGIFEYAAAIEGYLDYGDEFLSLLIKFILICTFSTVYIILSAALLQWAIDLPVDLHNAAVIQGWHFTLGLVNLFFALALLTIAFAYLLKIESFQAKKTLSMLVIVILLVNFSLLFVGMVVDVSEFFMNTLRTAFGGNFVSLAIANLKANMLGVIAPIMVLLGGYLASTLGIYAAIPVLFAIIIGFTSGVFVGMLFQAILFIVFNIVLGSIFFLYFILFIGRIVALWLLAIFSPVAFFCLIFPQTKQYFQKWLKALVQWAFMGVVALFLLGLITVFFDVITNRPGALEIGSLDIIPGFAITDSVFSYLFMMIFLGIAWYATKKYMPAGAAEGLAMIQKHATPRVMSMVKKAGQKVGKSQAVERLGQKMSQVKSYGQQKEELQAQGKWTTRAKITTALKSSVTQPVRGLGHGMVSGAQETRKEIVDEKTNEFEKATVATQAAGINSGDKMTRIGALRGVAKSGRQKYVKGELGKKNGVSDTQLNKTLEEAFDHNPEMYDDLKKAFPMEMRTLMEKKEKDIKEDVDKKEKKLVDKNDPEASLKTAKYAEDAKKDLDEKRKKAGLDYDDDDRKKYNTIDKDGNSIDRIDLKIMAELKGSELAKLDKETINNTFFAMMKKRNEKGEIMKDEKGKDIKVEDEETRKIVYKNTTPNQIADLAREGKTEFTAKFQSQIDINVKHFNKATAKALHTGSGPTNLGYGMDEDQWNKWQELHPDSQTTTSKTRDAGDYGDGGDGDGGDGDRGDRGDGGGGGSGEVGGAKDKDEIIKEIDKLLDQKNLGKTPITGKDYLTREHERKAKEGARKIDKIEKKVDQLKPEGEKKNKNGKK